MGEEEVEGEGEGEGEGESMLLTLFLGAAAAPALRFAIDKYIEIIMGQAISQLCKASPLL